MITKSSRAVLAGLLCLTLTLTITSCDVLEVEPSQSISSEVALSDVSGFEALLISAYDDLQDVTYYGQYFMLYPDALADNIRSTPGADRYNAVPLNAQGEHLTRWAPFYDTINKMNNIITQIDELQIDGVPAEEAQATKSRIEGEARFLRALNYFDLMRTKAYEPGVIIKGLTEGVIIRTEPTLETEDALQFLPRSPVEEVYQLIEQDLQQAIGLLDNPPLWSGASGSDEQFVANTAAAQALLAQVYLYWKRFDDAANMATQAMATAEAQLGADLLTEDEYVDVLSGPNNPGGIFVVQLVPNRDGSLTNTNEALSSLTYDLSSFNFQVVATQDLVNAHEPGDVRLELYDITPDGFNRLGKYTQADGSYTDDVVVIRVAEVLLIRAEARAESGNTAGAQDDLNQLRTNRGLEAISPTGQNLIDAILQEKRLELAFEGERFFDLKRRGMDIPKPQAPALAPALPYEDYRILAPLPSQQVENNPQLCQNPGYGGNECV